MLVSMLFRVKIEIKFFKNIKPDFHAFGNDPCLLSFLDHALV